MLLNNISQFKSLQAYLLRGASVGILLKVAEMGLAFGSNVIIANLLTPSEYGVFSYFFSIALLLGTIASIGFEPYLTREIGSLASGDNQFIIRRLLRFSRHSVFLASILISGVALLIGVLFFFTGEHKMAFSISMLSIPLFALSLLNQGALKGHKKILSGLASNSLIRPVTFLGLMAGMWLYNGAITLEQFVLFNICSFAASWIVGDLRLRQLSKTTMLSQKPNLEVDFKLRNVTPFMFLGALTVIHGSIDTLMLGSFSDNESIGLFNVANKIATVCSLLLFASNTALAPVIAELNHKKDLTTIQVVVTKTIRYIGLLSIPAIGLLGIFGKEFLMLFGKGYEQAYPVLIVLLVGHFINIIAGPVGNLANMTGNEKLTNKAMGISIVINIVLNAILIPLFGGVGAAIASTISFIVWNVYLIFTVKKATGINTTVFG